MLVGTVRRRKRINKISTPIQKEAKKKEKKKNERVKIKIFPRLSCPAKNDEKLTKRDTKKEKKNERSSKKKKE